MLYFTKMQGIGNDYIYINCLDNLIPDAKILKMAIDLSDRHFGIGSDGLILILKSETCDFRMRMFNSDGTEAEMCGNGIRCVGKYVYDNKLTSKTTVKIETLAGEKTLKLNIENDKVKTVTVDMGEPIFDTVKIPAIFDKEKIINEPIIIEEKEYNITCVSMGNPHCITVLENIDDLKIEEIGPKFENNKMFPKRINTEFIEILDRNNVKLRVWERGSGETLACGTGASATIAACVLNGFTERKINIKLLGGDLVLEWNEKDNHIYMTGPAEIVFKGEIDYGKN